MGNMNKKKLFISNLCWNKTNLKFVIKCIKDEKISGIDFAPLNFFENWNNILVKSKIFSKKLKKQNIKVNAIQGIFYKKNLNLFRSKDRKKITNHFLLMIKICKIFGAKKIILGSSQFRNTGKVNLANSNNIFIDYFKYLNKHLKKNNVYLCIETIPKKYNEKYIFKFIHILYLIKKINSSNIKINFDTSIFHFERSNFNILKKNIKYIKNIQVSQPNFEYFDKPSKKNKNFLKFYNNNISVNSISLEMISKINNPDRFLESIKNFKKYAYQ
tara:strand:- start:49 stop:864 length:816 start_codon:yes stop_codon:yes gene_type:complete